MGLTTEEAKNRLLQFGQNLIPVRESFSPLELLFSQFTTILSFILLVAASLSFALRDTLDGVFILAIVIVNGIVGFIQEFRAHRSLAALKQLLTPEVRVLRDRKEVVIPTQELVPGDIVILTEGEKIPADGRLIYGTHLEIDEAVLTGESIPVLKQPSKGADELFMSTTIVSGRGRMEVLQTGLNTRFGKIAKTLTEIKEEKTPLQIQLTSLGRNLGLAITVIALAILALGILQQREFFLMLLTSISIAIAAIPEGLPVVITIALALGMERMARKKAVVRRLAAIEALGAIQVLLIDKTGTLTKNEMRVKKVWYTGEKIPEFLMRASILGNSASLIKREDGENLYDVVGDKTDGALLLWTRENLGTSFENFREEGRVIDEYAFDPFSKTITIIWEQNGQKFVLVRGAPEKILEQTQLAKEEKSKIASSFKDYAKAGLRVIGFGYKKQREERLTFLGFVGIYDPPRDEAKTSVRLARQAGIKTIMVTGDNEVTAEAIAREIGLIEKGEDIVTGETLEKMTDEELHSILLKTRIFARVKPQDKLRLVEAYQKKGFVVGVTGDGVNDALALKKANVGVAMGLTGTDVAKEASDMVITDDNFATLVGAIEEGRTIYSNISKSITYLLSGNLAELSLIFFASLLSLPFPLLPTQILWINLVTDSIPALALAVDTKVPGLLKEAPRDPRLSILSKDRTILISVIGFGLALILLIVFLLLLKTSSEVFARTVTFNALVFAHMVIAFLLRGKSIFAINKLLIGGAVIIILMQIIISTTPVFQKIFHLGF